MIRLHIDLLGDLRQHLVRLLFFFEGLPEQLGRFIIAQELGKLSD